MICRSSFSSEKKINQSVNQILSAGVDQIPNDNTFVINKNTRIYDR